MDYLFIYLFNFLSGLYAHVYKGIQCEPPVQMNQFHSILLKKCILLLG